MAGVLFLTVAAQQGKGPTQRAEPKLDPKRSLTKNAVPFLNKYCVPCHGNKKSEDGINFEGLTDKDLRTKKRMLRKSAHEVEEGAMPPKDAKLKPTDKEKKSFVDWINTNVSMGGARGG